MKDINLAKEILLNENLALIMVKDGHIIYKSKDRGIRPLFTAYEEMGNSFEGAALADKVIGKAAAMFCKEMKISRLYTKLISEKAIEILDNTEIDYSYDLKVPYIKNMDRTGLCPVEKLSMDVYSMDELLEEIHRFFKIK